MHHQNVREDSLYQKELEEEVYEGSHSTAEQRSCALQVEERLLAEEAEGPAMRQNVSA